MFSRNRLFVLRETQMSMVFSVLAIVFVVCVITLSNLFYFFNYLQIFLGETENLQLQKLTGTAVSLFKTRLAILLIVDAVVIIILAFIMSHKIAGPLYKIRKKVDQYRTRDLTGKIKLRRTDLLFEMADSVNSCFDCIREDIRDLRVRIESLPKGSERDQLLDIVDRYKI